MKISLDKLLQKKIEASEVNLPSEVWKTIVTKLRKRRQVRLYWLVFGISFVILISSMLVFSPSKKKLPIDFYKNTNSKEFKDEQVKSEQKNNLITVSKYKKSKKIFSSVSNISDEKKSELSNNQNYNTIKAKVNNKLESDDNKNAHNYNKKEESLKDKSFEKSKKNISIKKKIKKIDSSAYKRKKDSLTAKNQKKWTITPVFGFSNSGRFTKNNSVIDSRFDENPTSGLISKMYGYKIEFKVSDKVSLQTGVISKKVSFITKELFLTDIIIGNNNLLNINYDPEILIRFSNNNLNLSGDPEAEKSSLIQTIGYLEIPIEIKYKLYNKSKFRTNFVGGLSLLKLNKNEILAKTDLFSRKIAVTNNLSTYSISFNVGLDIDYNLSKRFVINTAIMFKKHYQTYNRYSDKTALFVMGIHTGIGYRF